MFGFQDQFGRHDEGRRHGERGSRGRGQRDHHARDHHERDHRQWEEHGEEGWQAMRGGDGRHGRGGFGDFGRGFGGRGGHGGPSGRGRFFDHGDLKLVILALIAERPRHGYEIIKAIEDKVAGAYSPSPGAVYPTLTMLEELGYILVEVVAANRKQYEITEAGRAYLAENDAEVKVIFARMDEAGRAGQGRHNPQLARAVENLMLAVRLRLTSDSITPDQLAGMIAVLDEAAGKIGRG